MGARNPQEQEERLHRVPAGMWRARSLDAAGEVGRRELSKTRHRQDIKTQTGAQYKPAERWARLQVLDSEIVPTFGTLDLIRDL